MSLALDLSHASALNLANLQRIDSTIISIVSSSAFAAVYKLVAGAWERAEAEGPLFVVDRSSAPRFRVVVLNRITPKNFVLDLTPTLEWQLQDRNYFTFRNKDDPTKSVHALWFSKEEDRSAFVESMRDLPDAPPRPAPAKSSKPARSLVPTQVQRTSTKAAAAPVVVVLAAAAASPTAAAPAPSPVKSYASVTAVQPPPPTTVVPREPVVVLPVAPSSNGVRIPVDSLFASAKPAAAAVVSARPPPAVNGLAPSVAGLFASVATAAAPAVAAAASVDKAALKAALLELLEDDAFLTKVQEAYSRQPASRRA